TLFGSPKVVPTVMLEGLEINIPPEGEREDDKDNGAPAAAADSQKQAEPVVLMQYLTVKDATMIMLPRDRQKLPLRFAIRDLKLTSAGIGTAMKYDAVLSNPKPPGEIHSHGSFGPWQSAEPGETPLNGDYVFEHADLGVFAGIAGILKSTGRFEGRLNAITARGEANVPDFRLKRSGNHVPLSTRFEVLVDGINGNTTLKPVVATL